MFRTKKPLQLASRHDVPHGSGVYIVYAQGAAFYVGRSARSIRDRLIAHAQMRGSKKIREALLSGKSLEFEWEEMMSPHQAEAQLIDRLGVVAAGNLRRETDPQDW